MTAVRKFLFDNSFDARSPEPETADCGPEAPMPEPLEPTFSEAELEAARQEGFAAGRQAGAGETMAGLEQQISTALASANSQIEMLLSDHAAAAETRRAVAMRLALKAVETLFSSLVGSTRLAEIEGAIDGVLRQLEDEPRVVIRVADDLAETLRERLEAIAIGADFRGQLVLMPDAALGPGDARVEWASGGAERDTAQLWLDLRATVEAHLATLPETSALSPEALSEAQATESTTPADQGSA